MTGVFAPPHYPVCPPVRLARPPAGLLFALRPQKRLTASPRLEDTLSPWGVEWRLRVTPIGTFSRSLWAAFFTQMTRPPRAAPRSRGRRLPRCARVFVFTPAGTAQYFASLGLPPALACLTLVWETVGGVALILGIYSRAVAVAMIPLLLGTIYAVHGSAGFFFTNPTGGWEFPALWIVGVVAVALLGRWRLCAAPHPIDVEPPDGLEITTVP